MIPKRKTMLNILSIQMILQEIPYKLLLNICIPRLKKIII
jgi:hypothetical protein